MKYIYILFNKFNLYINFFFKYFKRIHSLTKEFKIDIKNKVIII